MSKTSDGHLLRLLIVDAERMILNLLTTQLTPHGFEVVTAADAWEAVMECHRVRFDLILLDLDLQFVEYSLRRLAPGVPLVFLSADIQREVRPARASGVDVILPKFQPTDVVVPRLRELCEPVDRTEESSDPSDGAGGAPHS